MRKICVVTGSRAEYGLLYWLLKGIENSSLLELQLVVTGMHLSTEYGFTANEILEDDFLVSDMVETQISSDTKIGMIKSLGLGHISMADTLARLKPDIVVILGDRYEILAVAQSASLLDIPVAHISGGEVTSGAVDDWIRHAITKSSWWHFVATDSYRDRVIQLGENPDRVFNVGDPALDAIQNLNPMSRCELEKSIGIKIRSPLYLVTYHPETLTDKSPSESFEELLVALNCFPEAVIVITMPNADAGGRDISSLAEKWAAHNKNNVRYVSSLGRIRYLSLMRYCNAVIGNSSSGIVEAPALKIPTVNIGSRQDGRLKASSIVDCKGYSSDIVSSIKYIESDKFRKTLSSCVSLYGDCGASNRIVGYLEGLEIPDSLLKNFYDKK